MRSLAIAVASMLAVVLHACGPDVDTGRQEADRLLSARQYDSARVTLNAILRRSPSDTGALRLQVLLSSVERRLSDETDALRKLYSLGATPDTALLTAALTAALKNGDGVVVVYGIRSCGELALPVAHSAVESVGGDRDDRVRQALNYAVPRYHPDGRAGIVDGMTIDHDPMVRAEALKSWSRIAVHQGEFGAGVAMNMTQNIPHMETNEYVLWNYALMCAALGEGSYAAQLRTELEGKSDVRRTEAAAVLALRGDRQMLRTVAAGLRSPEESARVAAARALGDLRATEYLDQLVGCASDASEQTREAVAYALGEIGDRHAIPDVQKLLRDKSWRVRATALVALRRLGSPDAEQMAIAALADRSLAVRASALAVLLSIRQ